MFLPERNSKGQGFRGVHSTGPTRRRRTGGAPGSSLESLREQHCKNIFLNYQAHKLKDRPHAKKGEVRREFSVFAEVKKKASPATLMQGGTGSIALRKDAEERFRHKTER